MNWEIRRYSPEDEREWNRYVSESRNGTFLFKRGYMDYHSDRFCDYSLMAYRNGVLMGVLPANREQSILYSHKGLTYGGWVFPAKHVDGEDVLSLFEAWREFCLDDGIEECIYKPVPGIYHTRSSQEDIYALFRFGAEKTVCNLSAAIYIPEETGWSKWQRRYLNIGARNAPEAQLERDASGATFYKMLEDCLRERHNTTPVHTKEEFLRLAERFPDNILPMVLMVDGKAEAGIALYLTDTVAHCQYICTTSEGREKKYLPLLVSKLQEMDEVRKRRWLDFGTSNEDNGRVLNAGLYHNKFSFGAGGVVYETYRLQMRK